MYVLASFFLGLILTIMAMFSAFFANTSFADSDAADGQSFDHPFIHPTDESVRISKTGNLFRSVAILLAISALAAATSGAWLFVGFADASLHLTAETQVRNTLKDNSHPTQIKNHR